MATRPSLTARPVIRRSLAVLAVVGCALAVFPAVSQANPEASIQEVERRVHALQEDAEAATEEFLGAQLEATRARRQLDQVNAKVRRSEAAVAQLRKTVGGFAAAAYRSGGLDQSFQLLLADDPTEFLAQASDLDGIARRQADLLARLAAADLQLAADQLVAQQQAQALADIQDRMEERKETADAKVAEAEELLASLKEEQRRQLAARAAAARASSISEADRAAAASSPSRGGGASASGPPASGRAAGALRYALAQVGKRYSYGGVGPSAFDCSGLTMMAYRSVGVSLPHHSASQLNYGRRVSSGDLQPGDLVFYYSPISHVGMYVGGGRMVHAANPSDGVRIDPVFMMPFAGAVRL